VSIQQQGQMLKMFTNSTTREIVNRIFLTKMGTVLEHY